MKNFYDIAIVGGGIAGLYSGLRLLRSDQHKNKKIALFEATNRLGGRIHSVRDTGLSTPCELGCMRYLKSQRMFANLIEKQYRLAIQPFDTGNVDKHIYYLRGKHIDLTRWDAPYDLPVLLKGQSPFQILDNLINEVKQSNHVSDAQVSPLEWAEIKKKLFYPFKGALEGQSLQNIGFANLISESTTYETLKFLCDSGEYYAKTINWNASEAFPYSQTIGYKAKDDIEYWCVKNGFSTLIEAMQNEYDSLGGTTRFSSPLKIISKTHDGKYRLLFQNKLTHELHEVIANQVLLALPKKTLKEIIWLDSLGNQFYSSDMQRLLESVRILPTIRFALLFKTPWWQSYFNGLKGHMVTDLPLRHGYYFGSENPEHYSVFLSTIDMDVTDYWMPHVGNHNEAGELQESAIREIMKQLCVIHKKENIEMPVRGLFANWCSEFYGGGFHSWNPGYIVSDTMKTLRAPFKDEAIYIVGESYSGLQGWAEGALCTVEKLMQEQFNLTLNEPWLDADYFYGY